MDILPTFKTRTIHYDEFEMKFWVFEDPSQEFGTSTSLDGCYLERPYFPPGVTVAFPIDLENDKPKFYLSSEGLLDYPTYLIDTPQFIREVEVKYPLKLPIDKALWAVLHVNEGTIDHRLQERIKPYKGSRFEQSDTSTAEYIANTAKKFLSWIREKIQVIPIIPITPFHSFAVSLTNEVHSLYGQLLREKSLGKITRLQMMRRIERKARPLHQTIATVYGLDYTLIKNQALSN
jgi:hypothetical protein